MDILDAAPTLPDWTPETDAALIARRRPGLGEFVGGNVQEGWWNTTLGAAGNLADVGRAEQQNPEPLTQEQYRASPYFREGVPWDARMTQGRAAAQAGVFDQNRYRRGMMEARDAGALETALGFVGQLLGSIPDPVNFLPIAGPLGRGLRLGEAALEAGAGARALGLAARTLERPGVAGAAIRGSVDAVGGNLAAAPLVYSVQAQFGDEITFGSVVRDLAVGALIGGGFGAAGGLLERGARARIQPDEMASVRVLDAAARDVAAGEPVSVPAPMAARAIEDAVMRSAPPEVARLVPEGADPRLADLPARPDGTPLTREDFDALLRGADTSAEARAAAAEAPSPLADVVQPPRIDEPALAPRDVGTADPIPNRLESQPIAPSDEPAKSYTPQERPRDTGDVYDWYREAIAARQHVERISATAPTAAPEAPLPPARAPAEGETRAMAAADTDSVAARQEIATMKAEGRLSAADEATLRAGDEAASEFEALAKGLEEAAACTMRRGL